jgi:hypothetical protein
MALRRDLPFRYSWQDLDDPTLILLFRDPEKKEQFYSPDVARQEMEDIKKQLAKGEDRLASTGSGGRGRRREAAASLERLVEATNQHTGGPGR